MNCDERAISRVIGNSLEFPITQKGTSFFTWKNRNLRWGIENRMKNSKVKIIALIMWIIFEIVAVVLWLSKDNIFYLLNCS